MPTEERARERLPAPGAAIGDVAHMYTPLRRTNWVIEFPSKGLHNLVLMDFQPFEDLPNVLASAAVLLAILEVDGGVFAVQSKVLSYLCAGRPIVLACPGENLAARIVKESRAGVVVRPDDPGAFTREALSLLDDRARSERCSENGVKYAAWQFDIGYIGTRFESVFHG